MFQHVLFATILVGGVASREVRQPDQQVHWSATVERISPHDVILRLDAVLAPTWYIYSQEKGGVAAATRISFDSAGEFIPVGGIREAGAAVTYYDEVYETTVTHYAGTVVFEQRVMVPLPDITITATVRYVSCNGHVCVPATSILTFDIKPD